MCTRKTKLMHSNQFHRSNYKTCTKSWIRCQEGLSIPVDQSHTSKENRIGLSQTTFDSMLDCMSKLYQPQILQNTAFKRQQFVASIHNHDLR